MIWAKAADGAPVHISMASNRPGQTCCACGADVVAKAEGTPHFIHASATTACLGPSRESLTHFRVKHALAYALKHTDAPWLWRNLLWSDGAYPFFVRLDGQRPDASVKADSVQIEPTRPGYRPDVAFDVHFRFEGWTTRLRVILEVVVSNDLSADKLERIAADNMRGRGAPPHILRVDARGFAVPDDPSPIDVTALMKEPDWRYWCGHRFVTVVEHMKEQHGWFRRTESSPTQPYRDHTTSLGEEQQFSAAWFAKNALGAKWGYTLPPSVTRSLFTFPSNAEAAAVICYSKSFDALWEAHVGAAHPFHNTLAAEAAAHLHAKRRYWNEQAAKPVADDDDDRLPDDYCSDENPYADDDGTDVARGIDEASTGDDSSPSSYDITEEFVKTASLPAGKSEVVYYCERMPGFGLRLRAAGTRTFTLLYTDHATGFRVRKTLGRADVMTLEEARKTARDILTANMRHRALKGTPLAAA